MRTIKLVKNIFETNSSDKIINLQTRKYLNVMKRSDIRFNLKQNNIFTFGFVRNPWDRAVSSWRHVAEDPSFRTVAWAWDHRSFKAFCRNLKKRELYPKNGIAKNRVLLHASEQHPFLICEQDNLKADFIGKFENLQEDFDIVCDKIGIPRQNLPHKNKTEHKHYTEYYDDETRQIVAEKYAKDIEYFGYEFGE